MIRNVEEKIHPPARGNKEEKWAGVDGEEVILEPFHNTAKHDTSNTLKINLEQKTSEFIALNT